MKKLKKIALTLCIGASISAVSTSVLAEVDPGRITYAPADAIDMVANKVGEALSALEKGEDTEKVSGLLKTALDTGKEINANDKVDAARSKCNNKVKSARVDLKNGAIQEAEQKSRDAQKCYLDLKGLL